VYVIDVRDAPSLPVRGCARFCADARLAKPDTDGGLHLAIPTFLRSIEASGLSMWMRDSTSLWAYPMVILFHTLGLALLAGPSIVLDLRILGVAPQLPLAPMESFHKIVWWGFYINLISGTVLLIAYPTKALTDPVFYLKMASVVGAMVCVQMIHNRLFRPAGADADKMAVYSTNLAKISLVCWFGAIVAGKFIEYTYNYIVYGIAAYGN
jgi:hypothetical protein